MWCMCLAWLRAHQRAGLKTRVEGLGPGWGLTREQAAWDAFLHDSQREGDLGAGGAGQALGQPKQLQEDRRRQPLQLLHKDLWHT